MKIFDFHKGLKVRFLIDGNSMRKTSFFSSSSSIDMIRLRLVLVLICLVQFYFDRFQFEGPKKQNELRFV